MKARYICWMAALLLLNPGVILFADYQDSCHDGGDCNHCHQRRCRPYFHRGVFNEEYYSDFGPSSGYYDPYTDRRNYYDPYRVRFFDTENGYYSTPTPDERSPND